MLLLLSDMFNAELTPEVLAGIEIPGASVELLLLLLLLSDMLNAELTLEVLAESDIPGEDRGGGGVGEVATCRYTATTRTILR